MHDIQHEPACAHPVTPSTRRRSRLTLGVVSCLLCASGCTLETASAQAPPDAAEQAAEADSRQEIEAVAGALLDEALTGSKGAPERGPTLEESRRWQIPPLAAQDPDFPFLPGEDQGVSRSIGDVSSGYLVNAHRLAFPHPRLAILERQSRRHLNYTTDEMAELVERAAAHVQERHPGAITYLGNFGAQGGGDIPYSVSHNSGRDADVAFFVTDEQGVPAQMPDLLPLDDQGRYEGEQGIYLFDVARNWALVEGFVEAGEDRLQLVFVSTPLKRMLLDHAREVGAPAATIAAADRLLFQPRSALPHNDHFHLRIACSARDRASGCEDSGRAMASDDERVQAALQARELLGSKQEGERLVAIRRLALLGERGAASELARRLEDDSPQVRAAAARALAGFGRQSKEMAARLAKEEHPRVVAELIVGLGAQRDRAAIEALVAYLKEPHPLALGEREIDGRVMVVDTLGGVEQERPVKALVGLLEELSAAPAEGGLTAEQEAEREVLFSRAQLALSMLTNHEFDGEDRQAVATAWGEWFKGEGRRRRTQWLVEGFAQGGFEIKGLNKRAVWDLCRAISGAPHLSYNAQRVLMREFSHYPASLEWSEADASFYWRRWLERRSGRLGLGRIPRELSTLTKKP